MIISNSHSEWKNPKDYESENPCQYEMDDSEFILEDDSDEETLSEEVSEVVSGEVSEEVSGEVSEGVSEVSAVTKSSSDKEKKYQKKDTATKEEEEDYNLPPLFTLKPGNEWIDGAKFRPDPVPLWKSFWYEGEVCCLFADSNLGKSIYAVEIANHIAQSRKIAYFDFELSDKQFQLRYTDEETCSSYRFPSNMIRAEIDTLALQESDIDLESYIITEIERACTIDGIDTLIIDNLSYLCNASDKSEFASRLMLRLLDLKRRKQFSILVLAHTPKRSLTSEITQNDLAGSKKLFNFFDSVFAIGKSNKDSNLRYIKQVKVRAGEFTHDSNNVILAEIVKDGNWLHFHELGCGAERDHLKEHSEEEVSRLAERIMALKSEGKSYDQISKELNTPKTTVYRTAKKYLATA